MAISINTGLKAYETVCSGSKQLLKRSGKKCYTPPKTEIKDCKHSFEGIGSDSLELTTSQPQPEQKLTTKQKEEVFLAIFKKLLPSNKVESLQTEFTSFKAAKDYAKSRAVAVLHSADPYEHMVVIDRQNNRIFGEYKGNKTSVSAMFDNAKLPLHSQVQHGHPAFTLKDGTEISTPVSFPDFRYINKFNCDDIVAYNKQGEFSLLRKKPEFKSLSEDLVKIYEMEMLRYIEPKLFEDIIQKLPEEFHDVVTMPQLYKKILSLKNSGTYTPEYKAKCKECVKGIIKEFDKYKGSFENLRSMENIRAVDRFWRDYADELGLIYRTNYTYL